MDTSDQKYHTCHAPPSRTVPRLHFSNFIALLLAIVCHHEHHAAGEDMLQPYSQRMLRVRTSGSRYDVWRHNTSVVMLHL